MHRSRRRDRRWERHGGHARGTDIDLVLIGHTIYAPAPGGHYPAITGKRWLAYQSSSLTPNVPTGKDAMALLRMMPGATGPVRIVGHDSVDHARTTHYRVTIDLIKAAAAEPREVRNAGTMAELQRSGVTTMPVDIWLDAQHALRQMTFALSVGGGSMHAQMRFRGSTTSRTSSSSSSSPPVADAAAS